MFPSRIAAGALVLLFPLAAAGEPSRMDFSTVDQLIEQAIAEGKCPNAEVVIGRGEQTLYQRTYGHRALRPDRQPMEPGLVFDLASLTKPMATATAVMILHERGKLNITDRVARHLPGFGAGGKQDVTIEQCLLHVAGFVADNPLADYANGRSVAIERIKAAGLKHPPGERFVYSDVGYIVLGELVEAVDGRALDLFAREEIFEPLGMRKTGFNPTGALAALCIPTEARDGVFAPGQVHDPRAHAMGGVAGHAGLFGSADDVARFCRMIVGGGEVSGGRRIMQQQTVEEMIRPRPAPDEHTLRTYGFDCVSSYDSPRGKHFRRGRSIGHTGYTGGSLWIDPDSGTWVVLLTSRLHPDGRGDVKALRYSVATAAAEIVLGVR